MINVTMHSGEVVTFDELGKDEDNAISYIVARYPHLQPEQRAAIRIEQNGMKCTNALMLEVEKRVRALGWAILFPVAKPRPHPKCPHCQSLAIVKIGRYDDGKCRVHCMDCQQECAMTNGEYYTSLVDEDQP